MQTETRLPGCSRRQFLRSTAVLGTVTLLPGGLLGASGRSLNSAPTLAGIGIGGVGHGQLQECAKAGFKIVALCDVDQEYAKKTYDLWPQARRYTDFRELLSAEGDKVDAVYCGTPDHTHALIVVAALKRKKHVCCVKPLTRTIGELKAVTRAAKAAGTATQVTAAPHTDESGCRVTELVQAGVIGPVRELHLWSNRPVWPQGMNRPPGGDAVPAHLDWKLWLGPAPERPFVAHWPKGHHALAQMNLKDWDPGIAAVYHPFNFRGWWDFGTGALGDMGCHHFNTPYRALKLGAPKYVEASATRVFAESAPLASIVTYEYPARGEFPEMRATWYDGGLRPAMPRVFAGKAWPSEGTLYVGERGRILHTWEGLRITPDKAAKDADQVPRTLKRRSGTWGEWFEACNGGETPGCNFQFADPLTEVVLLGNIALRTGKTLEWDEAKLQFTNSAEANQLVNEPYQNGWSLDAV
jgi:predicted dehydrogenase